MVEINLALVGVKPGLEKNKVRLDNVKPRRGRIHSRRWLGICRYESGILWTQIPIFGKSSKQIFPTAKKRKHVNKFHRGLINTKYFSYICKGIEPTKYLQTNNNQ